MSPADRVRIVIGLVVVLCCVVPMVALRQDSLIEPDLWWHIKTGAWIWQHMAFPTTDPFSYIYAGHPWIAKEWLSQFLLFAAFAAGGWATVTALGIAALALSAALLYGSVSAWIKPSVAATAVILGLLLASITFTMRPHLLSLPLIVVWTHCLFKASWEKRAPEWWLLAVMALWANLHAAFTMGFVIAAFACLDFVERTWGNSQERRKGVLRWLAFLALCPVVSALHPYLLKPMLLTWQVIMPDGSTAIPLTEWEAFNAQAYGVHAVLLVALVFACLTSGFRLGLARALLLVLLLSLFLDHMRYAFFLFPVMIILVAPSLAQQFPRLSARHWREQPLDPLEQRMGSSFALVAPLLAAGIALLLAAQAFLLPTAPPESVAVTAARDYVRSNGVTGHVMNYYNFGGPLIFDGIQTFIDGRTDQLFQGEFAEEFVLGPTDPVELAKALERYDVRWTIMPPKDARVALLDQLPGWQRVFADQYAVIHQRR